MQPSLLLRQCGKRSAWPCTNHPIHVPKEVPVSISNSVADHGGSALCLSLARSNSSLHVLVWSVSTTITDWGNVKYHMHIFAHGHAQGAHHPISCNDS